MKKMLIAALLFPLCVVAQPKKITNTVGTAAGGGHSIQITLKPYQNIKIYLGTHYGNSKVFADSCILNEKSEGIFQSKDKLTPGIYFVVSPKMSILFDLLVDDKQQFKIIADTLDLKNINIQGSKDNELFQSYSKGVNSMYVQLGEIEQNYKNAKTAKDSTVYKEAYITKDKLIKQKKKLFVEANPNSMMSFLLNTMDMPEAPSIPVVNGKADSLYPYRYVKKHYWDKVMFNDNRLVRTPFFENKVDEYFKNYISREPDSIINELDYMLTFAKTGKEIYTFLLFKFTNKYIAPEFMGQDKVFVHLYEKFFLAGDTVLLNENSKKSLRDRYYSLLSNQLGKAAPVLVLNDVQDNRFALHNVKANYTFVAFWDPTCGHCKEDIPKLDSLYQASWKNQDIKVLAVNINAKELTAWKSFISEHHLESWLNGYQTDEDLNREINEKRPTTIRQLYGIVKTPTYYLLDKDKKIIAKDLTIEQFNDFLQTKFTNNK